MARHCNAVFDRHAFDGNEGHDVGRSHARVRALMLGQIDQLGGLSDPTDGGLLNGFAFAHQRDDAAVVVGVHLAIKQVDARKLSSLRR